MLPLDRERGCMSDFAGSGGLSQPTPSLGQLIAEVSSGTIRHGKPEQSEDFKEAEQRQACNLSGRRHRGRHGVKQKGGEARANGCGIQELLKKRNGKPGHLEATNKA
jgi:hypothetical protein